jgi:hypothetical protein
MKHLLAAALAVLPLALGACSVGGDPGDDDGIAATDDADDGGFGSLAAQNPAPFDLHCLYDGEAYAQLAPNPYAADAIRYACAIQAAQVPYRFPSIWPWRMEPPGAGEGIDCSGLTSHVWFRATGGWTHLPHSAAYQESTLPHVSWEEMLPGDLMFYVSSGALSGRHVAMYMGNGVMIEAASSTHGVIVSPARPNVSSIGRVW